MNTGAKVSAEVVEFMTLFARLKDWCDEEPEQLADQAAADASVKILCNKVTQPPKISAAASRSVGRFSPPRSIRGS